MKLLNKILLNTLPNEVPLWATILVLFLGALGTFWKQISEFFIVLLKGKQAEQLNKLESDRLKFKKVVDRLDLFEAREREFIAANIAMATALSSMVDQYEKDNPENVTFIATVRDLISKSYAINERRITTETH